MQRFMKSVLIVFSLVVMAGCSQKLPLVSHAHVGHALTAWRDTPGEKGLFVVAENEVKTALDETSSAIASNQKAIVDKHLARTLIALNPDLVKVKTTSGYGAVRALSGATDHLVFAAESDDASDNLKTLAYEFAEAQLAVINTMKLAAEVTLLAQQSSGQEQRDLLLQLRTILNGAVEGQDINNDGKIGPNKDEYGLLQLREMFSTALQNEKPAYHPVEKKYLFGLIRLPSGGWAYRFNASGETEQAGYHDLDKGYVFY